MGETGNTQAVPSVPPQDGGLSFAGIFRVFYEPTAFFTKLKDNPKLLVPYLAVAVLLLISGFITLNLMVESGLQDRGVQMSDVPPLGILIGKVSTLAVLAAAAAIGPLLVALLALFWGNFIFGGKARFRQVFSLALYGGIITAFGRLLVAPLMLYKHTTAVSLSLAALLPTPQSANNPGVLYTLLSQFDVFIIWELIVVGIGLSVIYGISRNKGYLLSVLSIGLLSALAVAGAAVRAMFF